MAHLETVDSSQGAGLVADVRTNMAAIEALDTAIATKIDSDDSRIRRVDVDGFNEVEYFEGAGPGSGQSQRRESLIQEIRGWLDPDEELRGLQMGGRILW